MTIIGERLWIENGDGAAVAHRVIATGSPRLAEIGAHRRRAVPIQIVGGDRRIVPVSELTEAAPLSTADEAEYRRLDAELAGTIGDGAKLARFNALRLRSIMFGSTGASE
ncbi:MAG TPA: hypothetical protein VFW19_10770 [Allosphingosinicella sp.]|nr:hypothetical protein [Allosphingosinicella sp.]